MLQGGVKKLASVVVRMIVDANTKGINPRKAQCERSCGKFAWAKKIRTEFLKELKDHMKNFKATGMIVPGNFNEDVCSKNSQEFVLWMGLFETLTEEHSWNQGERDGAPECGIKFVDVVLVTEGALKFAEVVELME